MDVKSESGLDIIETQCNLLISVWCIFNYLIFACAIHFFNCNTCFKKPFLNLFFELNKELMGKCTHVHVRYKSWAIEKPCMKWRDDRVVAMVTRKGVKLHIEWNISPENLKKKKRNEKNYITKWFNFHNQGGGTQSLPPHQIYKRLSLRPTAVGFTYKLKM